MDGTAKKLNGSPYKSHYDGESLGPQLEVVRKNAAEMRKLNDELKKNTSELTKQNDDLKRTNETLRKEKEDFAVKVRNLEATKVQLEKEGKKVVDALTKSIEMRTMDELDKAKKNAETTSRLQRQIEEKAERVKELEELLAKQSLDLEEKQAGEAKMKEQEYKDSIEDLREKWEKKKEKCRKLQTEKDQKEEELQNKLITVQEELNHFRGLFEKETSRRAEEVGYLTQLLNDEKEHREQLEVDHIAQDKLIKELRVTEEQLEGQKDQALQEMRELEDTREDERVESQALIERAKEDIEQLRRKLEIEEQEKFALEMDSSTLKQQVKNLESQTTRLFDDKKQLQEEKEILEKRLEEEQLSQSKTSSQLNEEIIESKEEIETLRKQLEEVTIERDSMSEELQQKSKVHSHKDKILEMAEMKYRAEVKVLQRVAEEEQKKREKIQLAKDRLESLLHTQRDEEEQRIRDPLLKEIEELRLMIQRKERDNEEIAEGEKENRQRLEETVRRLVSDNAVSKKQAQALEEERVKSNKAIEKLTGEKKALAKQVQYFK